MTDEQARILSRIRSSAKAELTGDMIERFFFHGWTADAVAAELRAALDVLSGPPWQPIETAPKDGTAILVADDADCSIAKWDGRRGWVAMGDGFLAIASQGDTWTAYIEPTPTHWMPLPKPPQVQA